METLRPVEFKAELHERVTAPLLRTTKRYYIALGVLLVIVAWGIFAYGLQLKEGLIVTGMRDRVSWGLYISMYIFFIGVSMAGTFTSAILRITKASWRTPVIRAAEMVTASALLIAAMFILFNSRQNPQLTLYHLVFYGRWESPIIWDFFALQTYLVASLIYFFSALIPDLALCRDTIGDKVSPIKRWIFDTFAIGWHNSASQQHLLQRAITIMMILVIPVAVMMHSVTSWLFAMTLREPWDSPVFAVYFVGGAIYSGTGIIIILLAVMRKAYRLDNFITFKHFLYLSYLLLGLALIMFFFNLSELLTHAYKVRGEISTYLDQLFHGVLAPLFWTYLWGGIIAPIVIIALPFTRNVKGIVTAAVLVNIAMFLERYVIVIGGFMLPLNPYPLPSYRPTWVEWSLMAAAISAFVSIIMIFMKFVPNVAITEMIEEKSHEKLTAEEWAAQVSGASPQQSSAGGK